MALADNQLEFGSMMANGNDTIPNPTEINSLTAVKDNAKEEIISSAAFAAGFILGEGAALAVSA